MEDGGAAAGGGDAGGAAVPRRLLREAPHDGRPRQRPPRVVPEAGLAFGRGEGWDIGDART